MNLESWQAGLVLGAAFTLTLEVGARAFLQWRRFRGRKRCPKCGGDVGADGRGIGAMEKLESCCACGDTWPEGVDRGIEVLVSKNAHKRAAETIDWEQVWKAKDE